MNKVTLMGRLIKDPITRYSKEEKPIAVTKYILAVRRKLKQKEGEHADFIPCVVFGKAADLQSVTSIRGCELPYLDDYKREAIPAKEV